MKPAIHQSARKRSVLSRMSHHQDPSYNTNYEHLFFGPRRRPGYKCLLGQIVESTQANDLDHTSIHQLYLEVFHIAHRVLCFTDQQTSYEGAACGQRVARRCCWIRTHSRANNAPQGLLGGETLRLSWDAYFENTHSASTHQRSKAKKEERTNLVASHHP